NLFAVLPAITSAGLLSFQPRTNVNGTTVVTVGLTDNGGTALGGTNRADAQTFTIDVTPQNDPPMITGLKAITLPEDKTTNVSFTVGDIDTAVASLLTSALSSNTNLVDDAGLVISGGPTNRLLTITPLTNANGKATISVTANDLAGGLTISNLLLTVQAVNDPPSFLLSTNLVTAAEDAPMQRLTNFVLNISKGPTNEASQILTFTATPANSNLFAVLPAITSAGLLSFQPRTNVNGTTVVTVVLTDNGGTALGGTNRADGQTFTIDVTPQNDPPMITGLKAVTLPEDKTTNVNFTVGDIDTAVASLLMSARSSNTDLVDDASLVISGGPTNRLLTITPLANANGTATISVLANDLAGGLTTNSFLLTAQAVNDPPSFLLSTNRVTMPEDAPMQRLTNFVVNISKGPANEASQTLTFTATPANSNLFAVLPAITPTGLLSFQPRTNVSGISLVTVVLRDNGGTNLGGVNQSAPQTFWILAGITPPAITSQPQDLTGAEGGSAAFSVLASGSPPLQHQWRRNDTNLVNQGNVSGATSATLTLANVQLSDDALYSVVVTNLAGRVESREAKLTVTPFSSVVAWGLDDHNQATVPTAALSGVIGISAGNWHSLALMSVGTVVAWGDNGSGQTSVPAELSGVIAISAGKWHNLALKSDGTIVAWGLDDSGQATVPTVALSGVIGISAGGWHSLALKSDGTVVAWGRNLLGQTEVPAGLSGVVAISAGASRSLALKSDGTIVAWGFEPSVPTELSGVRAIAAGNWHDLALKSDGTIITWGTNTGEPPPGSDWMAIAAASYHSLALKNNGMVFTWAISGSEAPTVPSDLSGVVEMAAGTYHSLALRMASGISLLALSINDVSVTEGDSGSVNAVFTVTLSAASSHAVRTSFATWDGSATADSGDYAVNSGTLIFAPGETSKTVTVQVIGDSAVEPDETFSVSLSNPVGATIADGQGVGTIANDDTSPSPNLPAEVRIANRSDTAKTGALNENFVVTAETGSVPLFQPNRHDRTFQVSVATSSGKTYVLECKDSLAEPIWKPLTSVLGNGAVRVLTDPSATTSQRFYRVRIEFR
ncbi:MAG: immunoglobulin domain-containing protein, partial [Verrucomicrobia bacterium]|nr:immunoglobulin domain-containing protein [Verrucomicrobiota bacterium]